VSLDLPLRGIAGVNQARVEDYEEGMELRLLFSRLKARWWWILLSVVLFTAAFYTAAHVLTPIYRASTLLIPTKTDNDMDSGGAGGLGGGGIGGVASLVGINLGGKDSLTEEALAVLKSREFTDKFISDLNLMPVLYPKLWDKQTGKWKVDQAHQPTAARAFRYFDKTIRTVVPEKKTDLITVNIDWTDRIAAANWANELIQRLNQEMRQRATARADASVGYLEKEFESTNAVATREAIGRLIETQVRQRMMAVVTPEFAFRVIDHALAPDKNDVHFPNKFLMVLAGPVIGFIFGVLLVMGHASLTAPPRLGR